MGPTLAAYWVQFWIGGAFEMQRTTIASANVLEALGAIDTAPVESAAHWDFFRVKYPTPAGFKVASYLSLGYDCPQSEASARNTTKWKNLAGSGATYTVLVTQRSRLAQDLEKTATTFKARSATTTRELLFDNVVSSFMPRAEQIEERQYFIEPDVALPNGLSRPALNYLVTELLSAGEGNNSICADILVAPAGQGKTTLARAIARKVLESKRRAIPILVESAQWQNLINLTLPNVLNAALLQLIPDAVRLTNPKLLQLLVREQLLVPIFDGFDELCLHPHSNYSPTLLLTELLELVGDTGAKILITTRETFWETYGTAASSKNIQRLNLQGFSNDQRKRFFTKRLKRAEERDIANRLAREVGERLYEEDLPRETHQADRASGVPLLLELVALYVDGNPSATFAPRTKDPLGPLLEGVCERENVRQQLQIGAEKQMALFEELFLDFADDIPRADLATYVEYIAPNVTKDATVRFESHAFFSPGRDVRPRFESLRVYFVARWLANRLENAIDDPGALPRLAGLLEKNATGNTDVFDFLVRRFSTMEASKAHASISHAYSMIRARPRSEGAMSALFHLAQRIAQNESSRKSRTDYVLRLLGVASPLSQVSIFGQITGLDLGGLSFKEATFKDVEFHNCAFDGATEFVKSRFDGTLSFENCTRAGEVRIVDCNLSDEAEFAWDHQAGRASKRIINQNTARDALREILRKFLGPFGFSTIKEADRKTGPISRNACRDIAWDELFREKILEYHHISGVSEGGINIVHDTEIRHEVRNFLDNAALGNRLNHVVGEILRRV